MNGFQLMAAIIRKQIEDGTIKEEAHIEEARKEIRVNEFLATCDDDDLCRLFDSAAFNRFALAYLFVTVHELKEEGIIDEEQADTIQARYKDQFEDFSAGQVLRAYRQGFRVGG